MLHFYYGDGKGKTTAAMGLALRAAGRGLTVTIAQFLKSDGSGERAALETVPGVTLLGIPKKLKFVSDMDDADRQLAAAAMSALFRAASSSPCDLLVLDEIGSALSTGLLPDALVLTFLDSCPPEREVVMTGFLPVAPLMSRADYVTEMRCVKHPYQKGTAGRMGIEF